MILMHLECFCAVAKHLSFVKAANALYITQPTITKHVRALENELGFPLFRRNTRSVALTPEGELFYPEAQKMLTLYANAQKACMQLHQAQQETLSIGYFSNMSEFLFPNLFAPLREQGVHFALKLVKITVNTALDSLRNGEIDCMFAGEDFFKPSDDMQYHHLCDARCCALMHVSNPLSGRKELSPADMNGQQILAPPCRPAMRHTQRIVDAIEAESPGAEWIHAHQSLEEQLMLVISGQHMQIVPSYNCHRRPELAAVPFGHAYDFSYGILHLKKHAEKCKAFVRSAQHILG